MPGTDGRLKIYNEATGEWIYVGWGESGTSGTSGSPGTSGNSGTSGTSGTDGAAGTSGTSGTDGTPGTDGAPGTSGTSGNDGTSGTDGTDGTSGTSGTGSTTSPQFSGIVSMDSVYDNGASDDSSGHQHIDWNNGNYQEIEIDGDVILTFSAPPGPASVVLKMVGTTSAVPTVTWPASVKWPSGPSDAAPILTAGGEDIITFWFDGTSYYGSYLLDMA